MAACRKTGRCWALMNFKRIFQVGQLPKRQFLRPPGAVIAEFDRQWSLGAHDSLSRASKDDGEVSRQSLSRFFRVHCFFHCFFHMYSRRLWTKAIVSQSSHLTPPISDVQSEITHAGPYFLYVVTRGVVLTFISVLEARKGPSAWCGLACFEKTLDWNNSWSPKDSTCS